MRSINKLAVISVFILGIFIFVFINNITSDLKEDIKSPSPLGIDFAVYYTTSKMVISGASSDIYNESIHHSWLERTLDRKTPFYLAWVYPPSFLLMIVPFAFLPYYWAMTLWLIITFLLALFSVYLLVPKCKQLALVFCSFPGILMNLRWGQNGFLNTALFGFGIYFLDTNPILSGLMFGLLTYKPQLAFVPFLLLLFQGKWKVLLWSAIFSILSVLTSGLLFGFRLWLLFFENFFNSSSALLSGVWENTAAIQPTFYSSFRLLGLDGPVLIFTLLLISVAAAAAVIWVLKKSDNLYLKGSVLILSIFLISPYYLQYDLMLLSLPFILLMYDMNIHSARPFSVVASGLLWFMPMLNMLLVQVTRVQICPFIVVLVLIDIIFRVKEPKIIT
jgi:hypothetical protein